MNVSSEYQRKWRLKNSEHWQTYRKKYIEENREKVNAKQRRFNKSESGKKYYKEYTEKNRQRINSTQKRYESKNWFGIPLTTREQQIYISFMYKDELIAAKELSITKECLQTHKRKIKKKLGINKEINHEK